MHLLPKLDGNDCRKVRILYGGTDHEIEVRPYLKKTLRTLQIVRDDTIEYTFKSADRNAFEELLGSSAADDIIISKQGLVTDSSYANLAFFDGEKWFTPDSPLLEGVQRAHLIKSGTLHLRRIAEADVHGFQKVSLINAMLPLGALELSTSNISPT